MNWLSASKVTRLRLVENAAAGVGGAAGLATTSGRDAILSRALTPVLAFAVAMGIAATVAMNPAMAEDKPAAAAAPDPHVKIFAEDPFPSAVQCAQCHPRIFAEWSSSNHAYASISPMFHKFEQTISDLSSGTIGTFCVRCHQQVATQNGEARELALWNRSEIAREGITCITCHRVSTEFGKVNGDRNVEAGTIFDPVFNSGRARNLPEVLKDPEFYRIAEAPGQPGTPIHTGSVKFTQITQSEFCVSCHQVAVHPGIKLEVVWDQYRDSPAARAGVTCQQCHMGKYPGEAKGYDTWPIAIVNGRVVGDETQRHSNHAFYGPGYPIAHPGLFPFNQRSLRWSIEEWLKFDYRAPWGDPKWEDKVASGEIKVSFPDVWSKREDRETARLIVNQNLRLLDDKKALRKAVMENGSRIDGPYFDSMLAVGSELRFHYRVTNIDTGHNLPSGSLGAQPEIWLNVALSDPDGKLIWESGYIDKNGDMADLHSLEVAKGNIPGDHQLFNLQTKFLTTNVKGTDREMYLPVNFDIDQIPFIRPSGVPTSVLNHPPFIRMEGRSVPPLGYREANYHVPSDLMTKPGTYRLQVRLRSRAEPIYFMKFVGATRDMEQSINEWMLDIHPQAVQFEVH
ncbi:MAG TPA: multiheme c-type cytochrome [Candidatus Cybelea sp.]|nr:multiheme c-type cytochrome [Candidatus Cybelea sp.]